MDTNTIDTLDRTPDGLTAEHVWVLIGGCPVWRGYDPRTQPAHREREAAFIRRCERSGLEVDRCSCGGLGAWDGSHPQAQDGRAPVAAHYPPQFLTETAHGAS